MANRRPCFQAGSFYGQPTTKEFYQIRSVRTRHFELNRARRAVLLEDLPVELLWPNRFLPRAQHISEALPRFSFPSPWRSEVLELVLSRYKISHDGSFPSISTLSPSLYQPHRT